MTQVVETPHGPSRVHLHAVDAPHAALVLGHAADDAGYVLHATGGAGASAMIIAASLAFLRSGVVRPWAGWLGVAAGILALASIAFFPQRSRSGSWL
jgi:hypothetical protein